MGDLRGKDLSFGFKCGNWSGVIVRTYGTPLTPIFKGISQMLWGGLLVRSLNIHWVYAPRHNDKEEKELWFTLVVFWH